MSLRDLRQLGVLLPHEEWGGYDLRTTVNKPAMVGTGTLAVVAMACMYAGDGGVLTFVGIGLFLAFMGLITRISLLAVEAQAERFKEQREEIREELAAEDASAPPPEAP